MVLRSLADSVARDFLAVRPGSSRFVRSPLRVLVEREPNFEIRSNVLWMRHKTSVRLGSSLFHYDHDQ